MNRKTLAWLAGVATVILAVGIFVAVDPLGIRGYGGDAPVATGAAPTVGPPQAATEAEEVASALAGMTRNPREAVVNAGQDSFDPTLALPEGSRIEPEPRSWAPDGFGGGTMNAILHVPGELDERYVAIMVQEDGTWKLLQTILQSEGEQ